MLNRVLQLAADVFQVDVSTLNAASSPDTVGAWDSLHHLSLVVALEQEFGVQISPEEIEQLLTLELIADLMAEKLQVTTLHDRSDS